MLFRNFVIFGMSSLILACQIKSKPILNQSVVDGAPLNIVKSKGRSAQIVIPKNEPHSRYGNPDSYSVLGKTYHVLSSANGFKQAGIASWYGTKFHMKRTSSGEIYDMFAMTAAHKTLPLPTYVKVKNIDNKREIIVKVNDRGPFHDGRIIDLSYAGAKALGILKNGVGKVMLESVKFDGSHNAAPLLYLQIGAFQDYNKAHKFKLFIESVLTSRQAIIEVKKEMFAVIMGPFKSKVSRLEIKQSLLVHGINGSFSFFK